MLGVDYATAWRPSRILFLIFGALGIMLHIKARAGTQTSGPSREADRPGVELVFNDWQPRTGAARAALRCGLGGARAPI
jgi:hypothetical protein